MRESFTILSDTGLSVLVSSTSLRILKSRPVGGSTDLAVVAFPHDWVLKSGIEETTCLVDTTPPEGSTSFMFIGYKTLFTKSEALLFIEVLMIAMRDTISPPFLVRLTNVFHRMICCRSELTTNDYKDVSEVITKMHLSYSKVNEFLSLKSKPGSYYRPRYDRTGIDVIDQQGLACWIDSIDKGFSSIIHRVWGSASDDIVSKMIAARVQPHIVNELVHYMQLRKVVVQTIEPVTKTLRYQGNKPSLRLIVDNTMAVG